MVYYRFFPSDHLVKIVHVFSGIYLCVSTCCILSVSLTTPCHRWEFFTTLDFEWEVFTGKRPWRWSFVVYLAARLLGLMATVGDLVGFNLTSMFDCNVSIRSGLPLFSTD